MNIPGASRHSAFVWAICSGLFMGLAWQVPGGLWCALLGWCAAFALVAASKHPLASYRSLYLTGLIQNALGFYWIANTVQDFGGFPAFAAYAVFALFVLVSALQNVLYFFFYRNLPGFLDRRSCRVALAWIAAEFLSPRIFPWMMGHTQLAFLWLSQSADIAGATLISFIMLWLSEALFPAFSGQRWLRRAFVPLCFVIAVLCYGRWKGELVRSAAGPALDVTIVQANISTIEKSNIRFFQENRGRYEAITKALSPRPELVLWPETVVQDGIRADTVSAEQDRRIPHFPGKHLLTGALTVLPRSEHAAGKVYNSALAVFSDGTIPAPYHKQILMPFGEYMPLSSVFPWIQELNPIAGGLSAGTDIMVQEFPALSGTTPSFKLSPLICYEDVVPELSRNAAARGAQVLVNLTNDAWFGNTVAPYQHHLIASFRAIETGRYLIRSTNSGLSAVVNARGETIASLPTFSEGSVSASISLLSLTTPYVRGIGEVPWWILCGATALTALWCAFAARRRAT